MLKIQYNETELTAHIKQGRHLVAIVYAGSKEPTMERVKINAEALMNGLVVERKRLLDELDEVMRRLSHLPAPEDSEQSTELTERYIKIKTYLNGF